jgi:pimeloyl-ACP methyl ester carboxylesterase
MIHVLPGMGADRRMYPGAWRRLPDCNFINWPRHDSSEMMTDLARCVIAGNDIRAGATLIGSSLGGMVACEIANLLPVENLILVGSATSRAEVSTLLKLLHPLMALVPLPTVQKTAAAWPSEVTQMFKDSDPAFLRAMTKAIFVWDGLQANAPRPLRIHGHRDHVIPPPPQTDHLLAGGHLIAMTHATQCVEIIRHHLDLPFAQ